MNRKRPNWRERLMSCLALISIFLVVLIFAPETVSSQICGDINSDQSITVLDITYFIAYLYKGGPNPENLALCDVNHSESINILDILYLLSFLYKQAPAPSCTSVGPYGSLISDTGCKTYTKETDLRAADDCFEWEYINGWTLRITHINAAFNCCAETHADFYISNDTIIISESESYGEGGPCPCLCLYDIGYEFSAIAPGEYFVKIIGMYIYPADSALHQTINIAQNLTGSFCVSRNYYPWDLYNQPTYGSLLSHSGCLSSELKDSTLTEDCVVYNYTVDSVLTLVHLNDLFNCCPESLYAEIDIQNNIINITEWEDLGVDGGCDCICIYNLNYGIYNLPPGLWTIKVDNPYYYSLYGDGKIIEFEVDLSSGISGYFCVDREYLPWYQDR